MLFFFSLQNEQRLVDINKRLEISHQKVENLRHTNKAITIYAPAKYPAAKCFADIPMTFGWTDDNTPKASTQQNYQIRSGLVPISHKNVNDKLKFYHVPTQTENLNSKIQNLSEYSRYEDGLGVPPANIDSINALLLFDKAENPYNNYRNAQKTDTAGRVSRMTRSDTSSSVSKMEAAPSSIVNRKLGTKKVVDNLFYTPGLHEAPAIDAPFDLPDLPGIADDISFNVVVNEHAIAPSVSSGGLILPDLPDIEGHAFSMATDSVSAPQTNNGTRDLTTSVIGGENVVDSVPTVPPPPPLPLMVQYHAATPPPPPPPLPPIELLKGADKSTSTLAPKHDNNAARNNLMEAIRLAGGKAKLRAAAVQQAADIRKVFGIFCGISKFYILLLISLFYFLLGGQINGKFSDNCYRRWSHGWLAQQAGNAT